MLSLDRAAACFEHVAKSKAFSEHVKISDLLIEICIRWGHLYNIIASVWSVTTVQWSQTNQM